MEEINPWWFTDKWEREDADIKKWKNMEIRWTPCWINRISLKPFSLNFVIGTRQVGKTTGLKLLIKDLIERGKDARSITYMNCEILLNAENLKNWFSHYFEKRKERDILILDEITAIEDWWKVVKFYIDAGKFSDSVLIISGSLSSKLKKYSESFPGRRGRGKEILVLPLSFREFLEVKRIDASMENRVKKAFDEFLVTGGFPRTINKDFSFYTDFIGSFENTLLKIDRNPKLGLQIVLQIIKKAPSALSFNAIASELGISHLTVMDYVERFEEMLISKIIYWKGKEINFRKEKKIILRDPAIVQSFAKVFNLEIRKDFLYEWIVQEHLLRKYREVYYYRDGYEIDCIAGNEKIEVKAGKPHRKYPRGVNVLEEGDLPRFLLKM